MARLIWVTLAGTALVGTALASTAGGTVAPASASQPGGGGPGPKRTVMASPARTRSELRGEVASVGSAARQVAVTILVWGCVQEAASTPGASTALGGPEAATHAIATCRPVPPTDRAFPTAVTNPGLPAFASETRLLRDFSGLALAGPWPRTITRSVAALRRMSAVLAGQLATGENDPTWSGGVRATLIRLDALVGGLERRLVSGR